MAQMSVDSPATPAVDPSIPWSATVTTVLSDDVVVSSSVVVQASSPSPMAPFVNPTVTDLTDGSSAVECLAVVQPSGSTDPLVVHVSRAWAAAGATEAAWATAQPFGQTTFGEVAAGTHLPGSPDSEVRAFLLGPGGLSWSRLGVDGATWSAPELSVAPSSVADGAGRPGGAASFHALRTGPTPSGALVAFCVTDGGDLVSAAEVDGSYGGVPSAMGGAAADGDYAVVMTGESAWMAVINQDGNPLLAQAQVGAGTAQIEALPGFSGTVRSVVLGYNTASLVPIFLLVDSSGALICWSPTGSESAASQVGQIDFVSATGQVAESDGTLHVYGVDASDVLWVVHQDPTTPWNDDNTPRWATPIPLDNGIGGVAGALDPAAAPTLFAMDGTDGSLRVHVQDAATSAWRSGPVLAQGETAYRVVRWRSELALRTAYGTPTSQSLTVAVQPSDTAAEVTCAGAPVVLTTDGSTLDTDYSGRLTLSSLALGGLAAPSLTVSGANLPEACTFTMADAVHTYLSGAGTLNPTNPGGPLPTFDSNGATLAAAMVAVDGQSVALAPAAATNATLAAAAAGGIRNTAQLGLGTGSGAGYTVNLDSTTATCTLLNTRESVAAEFSRVRASRDAHLLGGFIDHLEHFFGDVWEGIKNGVIQLAEIVVDGVKKLAALTLKIADDIAQGVELAIAGLEQAGHVIAGIFQAVEADVDRVLDWLKAMFDFGAIWDTKMALEQAISTLPGWVSSIVAGADELANGYFAAKKSDVHQWIGQAQTALGSKTFADLQSVQAPGQPPSSTPIGGTGLSPSVALQNVHHNWAHDKVSSLAPSDSGYQPSADLESAWTAFSDAMQASWDDLTSGLGDFANAIKTLLEDPSQFSSKGLSDLLGSLDKLVDAVLDLLDALFAAFRGLTDVAMTALAGLLDQHIGGPLQTLWQWIADLAGHSDDGKLTISSMVSLLAAFPVTIIYKLIKGVDEEPFPGGTLPTNVFGWQSSADALTSGTMPEGCRIAASILQILYVVPALGSDLFGPYWPWWLSVAGIVWTAAGYVLSSGLPSEKEVLLGGLTGFGALTFIAIIVPSTAVAAATTFVLANSTDVANLAFSVVGLVRCGFSVYHLCFGDPDPEQIAADFLVPLPNMFSFLLLSTIRNTELVGLVALLIKVAIDWYSYIGSGVAMLLDAVLPAPQT